MLYAFGFESGYSMAASLAAHDDNPWQIIDDAIADPPSRFSEQAARFVTQTMQAAWATLQPSRKSYLELLSRVTLSYEQAQLLISEDSRRAGNVAFSDADALSNPYLLYERTKHLASSSHLRITPKQVDRAIAESRPTKHEADCRKVYDTIDNRRRRLGLAA